MPSNFTPNFQDLLTGYAEGKISAEDVIRDQPPPYFSPFAKMIVFDVVSDPKKIDEDRRTTWHGWGVTNMKYVDVLPRNTIVAKRVGDDSPAIFAYPFFPSHLSLPCKPGECVWVMFENPAASSVEVAYWMCKVVEPHTSDDVNHSHPGRSIEPTYYPTIKEVADGALDDSDSKYHELRNSPVSVVEGVRTSRAESQIVVGLGDDIFEKLVTTTEASKLSVYESVPRFNKRPGDVVLEGSNNALVVLGTDRTSPGSGSVDLTDAVRSGKNGTIDIVAGRGSSPRTSGKSVDTTSIFDAGKDKKGSPIKKELDKSPSSLASDEGDPDMTHDRSRVLVSQRTKVDSAFGLSTYNAQFSFEESPDGDPTVVVKTDKVRFIARADVEILVTDFDKSTDEGFLDRRDESTDVKKWASIVIKANGDIVFTPSEQGFIRLGGPDADKGIVCSDQPVTTEDGTVVGKQLVTTMGGSFAGSVKKGVASNASAQLAPNQGKFASKVLIKLGSK